MADNVEITAGSGTAVSTEQITTLNGAAATAQHLQRLILALRIGDGEAQDIDSLHAMPTSDAAVLAAVDGVETQLASLLTELGQKLEPTDLASLALDTTLQAVRDRLGEVQANPTANTVLDRLKALKTSVDQLHTDLTGALTIALPTGAATSARQDTANTSLASIDGKIPAAVSSRVPVDPSGVTSPVSAASLPLPSGAATDANLNTLVGSAGTGGPSLDTGASGVLGWLRKVYGAITGAAADGGQATIGTTTDASSANTLVGLLKAIKAAITGTLTTSVSGTVLVDNRRAGTWGYQAGVSGTESSDLTGKTVLAIFASAPTSGNGSVAINGGDSITVPAGKAVNIEPRGVLTAPSIVFTGTDAYFIETVA